MGERVILDPGGANDKGDFHGLNAAAPAIVATIVVAALGLRVGHAGGELVYVHGAASAYAQPSATPEAHREARE